MTFVCNWESPNTYKYDNFKLKVKPDKSKTNTEKMYHNSILRNTVKVNQVSPDRTTYYKKSFKKRHTLLMIKVPQ